MLRGDDLPLPWWEKYTLTIGEASVYFGIGEKTLRRFLSEHDGAPYILKVGVKVNVKRILFERYVDTQMSVL